MLALGRDGEHCGGGTVAAVTDAVDFTLGRLSRVEVHAKLRQGRSGQHGDEPRYELDQRLHRRSPLFERPVVYALKTVFEQSRSA